MDKLSFDIEINGISKTISSVADATKQIKILTAEFVNLSKAGKDVSATLASINQATQVKNNLLLVSKGAVQMQQGMQGAQTASANASMALLNLNYVIRDSPYFFNNFALGVLAVGNNINPLIDSFNRLRTEAVGKSISTFQLLKQALVGGAGISIAFSVVVTAIQSFVFWQSKSNRETKEATENIGDMKLAVDDLTNSFSEAIKKQQEYSGKMQQGTLELEIASMESRQKALGDKRVSRQVVVKGTPQTITDWWSPEDQDKLESLKKKLQDIQQPFQSFIDKSEDLARVAILGVDAIGKLDMSYKDITASVSGFTKMRNEYDPESKEFAYYDKIIKNLKAYEKSLDPVIKKLKEVREAIIRDSAYSQSTRQPSRPDIFAGRGFFSGYDENKRFGMLQAENNKASGFGGQVKDLGMDLEMGKIAAQELGNALAGAFEQGNIKLKEFIQSMIVAITKMVILRAVTGFLTGGVGAAIPTPISPAMAGNATLGKQSPPLNINVNGKLEADGNKFIAGFNKSNVKYNRSVKVATIGRD